MKRFVIAAFLALAIGAGSLFAEHPGGWGIGLQGGWSGGGGGGLTIKAPKLPIYWTINAGGGWLNVSGDYYFIDKSLVSGAAGTLGWYLGVGGFVNFVYNTGYYHYYGDHFWLGLGAEVPIGLSWLPLDFLELYIQAVPFVGLGIYNGGVGLWPGIGGSLGVRFWF
ncbi:MAG: hypothetical protein LBL45_03730 [Treponema sp.]|jgi:hypothetical protein|nr:hypothetical protein [Treponema sp.]